MRTGVKWLMFSCVFLAPCAHAVDLIQDDYKEKDKVAVHSKGEVTYNKKTNTLHVRRAHIRGNYTLGNLQLLGTLEGSIDTHKPETAYTYRERNVDLYDYGFYYQTDAGPFISMRGAGSYTQSWDTFLLLPAVYDPSNAAEFDSVTQYLQEWPQGPGLRVGYSKGGFTVGYSQADHRHYLPMTVMAQYQGDDFSVRSLVQHYNYDPLHWSPSKTRYRSHTTAMKHFTLAKDWSAGLILEPTFDQEMASYRLEQNLRWTEWVLAFREIYKTDEKDLYEAAAMVYLEEAMYLGLQANTLGNVYLGARIDF